MPIQITDKILDQLKMRWKEEIDALDRRKTYVFPYASMLRLYATESEIAQVQDIMHLITPDSIGATTRRHVWNDDGDDSYVRFKVQRRQFIPSREGFIDPDNNPHYKSLCALVDEWKEVCILQKKMEVAGNELWRCKTLEKMRYLCPPIVSVFGRTSYSHYLEKLGPVKNIPVPSMAFAQRVCMKEAIQQITANTMMGVHAKEWCTPYPDSDEVGFMVCGDVTCQLDEETTVTVDL